MEKIKVYKVICDKAYLASVEQGEYYSLRRWGKNTPYYQGEDVGEGEYYLPEGYEVVTPNKGRPKIFRGDVLCTLVEDRETGLPRLLSNIVGPILEPVD